MTSGLASTQRCAATTSGVRAAARQVTTCIGSPARSVAQSMKTVRHPARRPASMSRHRSPTMKLRLRSMSWSVAAARSSPGAGFRQPQRSRRRGGRRLTSSTRPAPATEVVDGVDNAPGPGVPPGDVRLVGDHDQQEPCLRSVGRPRWRPGRSSKLPAGDGGRGLPSDHRAG